MTDKENLVAGRKLHLENGGWYEHRENARGHLIVRESFLQRTDTIGLLFRIHGLCMAKVTYFRANIDRFEPLRYHYRDGFFPVPLWDAEFLRHRRTGYVLDLRYLQSITVYDEFVALCAELEAFDGPPGTGRI